MHRCVLIALLAALLVSPARAAVLHVDANAVPGGDGSTWNAAFAAMENALAAAGDGDELWIATGTYVPAATSFEVGANVAIYGGFAGTEVSRDERDPVANVTILSGDVNGDDGPDFTNRDDNVGSVLAFGAGVAAFLVDGCTIGGGEAVRGGGILGVGVEIEARACRFTANCALQRGGAIQCDGGSLTLADCTVDGNRADGNGGCGINAQSGAVVLVERCVFDRNVGAVGVAMRLSDGVGTIEVRDCDFIGQSGVAGGGAFITESPDVLVERCRFVGNATLGGGAGMWIGGGAAVVSECVFIQNDAGPDKGGGLAAGAGTSVVNCLFSENRAAAGGGIYAGGAITVVNCSLSGNVGGAIGSASFKDAFTVLNSVIWGNTPDAFTVFPTGPLPDANALVSDSIVQGGHPGSNNLDADPLFRQPGLHDLQLTAGSPAIDAGMNMHLPPGYDEYDLNGAPRIQNGTVDMGAYEGVFDGPLAPAASAAHIGAGEAAFLAPLSTGPAFAPIDVAGVVVVNTSDDDGGAMSVIQPYDDPHPAAGGYRRLGDVLEIDTTLDSGAYVGRVSVPFDVDDLDGVDPLEMDVTVWDPTEDTWALAVSANVGSAPIGTRFAVSSVSNPALNFIPGDYGVYWNPSEQRGFAWANVNHTSTFGVGVPRCRADVAQPPNGSIGFADLMAVLAAWGSGAGPTDVDFDGAVGLGDVTALLQDWGVCQN